MEPLKTIKETLIWLCVCQPAECTSKSTEIVRMLLAVSVFVSHVCGLITHLAYALKNARSDPTGSVFAFGGTVGFTGVTYILATVFVIRQQISVIFEQLLIIYKNHENTGAMKYLSRLNDTIEWICKFYMKCSAFVIGIILMLVPTSALFCWMEKGHFNANHTVHVSKIVVPWNQTTLIGYFGEEVLILSGGGAYLIGLGVVLLLFVSICMHHQTFCEIFEQSIDAMNGFDKNHRNDEQMLCDLMRFHISVKEWFLHTVNVYSPIVLIQLISSMIMMSTYAFYLDLQLKDPNIDTLILLCLTTLPMDILFIYCYYGKISTDSFANMSDFMYMKLQWDCLPLKLQKYVVLMIGNMDRPLFYHGFQVAVVDLNTFIRLLRTVFTYYMMLKTFTSD